MGGGREGEMGRRGEGEEKEGLGKFWGFWVRCGVLDGAW